MEDYRVTQTGDEIQEILNQSPIDTADIVELKEAATSLDGRLESVEGKIPAGASEENPLTDKQYVDDSIASASATFRGTYNEVTDLELTTEATHADIGSALDEVIELADSNDYCFVQIPTADATPTEIESIERYKFVTGTGWQYEYTLNNSGFTAEQWAAINSGITSGLVAKLTDLPTNAELETLLNGKANAADVYTKSETYNKTELDAQLGAKANSADVYEKSQTYTKQEVDALITTPEVQYVTVTATSGTTSVTDVLPATGAANTIYRVGSWDGTQYATGVYSEYAWNGTTYILLDVKNYGFATGSDFDNPTSAQRSLVTTVGSVLDGMPEGVFDVSARNSGSTWASLSALLSDADLDTLIPASWRKGGMSIRFVCSSDNNSSEYVQYRLMKDTFSAAVADWQGVDSELVAGSKNLVESGVVYEKFLNIKKLISGFIPTTCTFTVSDDGETISVSAGYCFYGNRNISVSAHTIDTTVLNGNFGYLYFVLAEHKYYLAAYTSADIENSMICGVFRPADKTLALFDSYWIVRQLKSISAAVSYAECSSPAAQGTKVVNVDDYTSLLKGGCLKIKMQYGHTYANGASLKINNTYTKTLYYNGRPCSSTNGWHAGDIIEVFYDGSVFQAFSTSNAFVTGQSINNLSLVNDVPAFDDYSDAIATGRAVLKYADNTVADKAGRLSDFFMYQNWLQSNGSYLGDNNGRLNYKCVCVPVVSGDVIKISKAANTNAYCAFLKSESNVDNFTVSNPAADLCSGESRRTIEANASNPQTLTAPSDAAYLYVGIYNGVDCTPEVFTVNGYDYTKTLKEQYLVLQEDLNEIRDLISPELKFPTNTWDSKDFTSNTGTDGIFFDRRNKITSGRTLEKIGVKTRYAGKVKIHYLSTIPPYAEITNEVHDVSAGINEFSPTAELDYSQDFYVAFSNVSDNSGGVMLVYPTDNTGQGTKITIATGQATDNTYAYALWIEVTENRFDKLENEIEELKTNGINTLEGLKKAIANNIGLIRLDGVEFTLDGPLFIPSGTKLTGVRGKTIINVPSTVLKGIELNNVEDVTIENITLVGAYNGTPIKTGLQPVKPGVADTADDIRQFVNAGYQTDMENGGVDTSNYIPQLGINIKSCEKIEIIGCEIKNFSYYGIANALSGKNYRYACKFENNYINNCYCGIYLYNEAERSQYIANNVSLCQIGLYMDSGTNMFTDCAFSANRVGMFMGNGWNHAHGVQTGNAFTHCSLFSIYAYNVGVGEVFTQCKFGYIDNETGNSDRAIYIKNSRGLSFNNCQMIQCNIAFDGKFYLLASSHSDGTEDVFGNKPYNVTYTDITGQASQYNGGVNQLLGCCYISGGGTITLSSDLDATNVIMKNNFFITGQSSSGVNN